MQSDMQNMPKKPFTKRERLEKEIAEKTAELEKVINKENNEKRDRENKQKYLLGAAVWSEAERRPDFKRFLAALMDRFLTRNYDRSFFSKDSDPFILPPHEKQPAPAPVGQEHEPARAQQEHEPA